MVANSRCKVFKRTLMYHFITSLGVPHLLGLSEVKTLLLQSILSGTKGTVPIPCPLQLVSPEDIVTVTPEQEGNAISPIPFQQSHSPFVSLKCLLWTVFGFHEHVRVCHCGPADGWLCFSWFLDAGRTSNNAVSS